VEQKSPALVFIGPPRVVRWHQDTGKYGKVKTKNNNKMLEAQMSRIKNADDTDKILLTPGFSPVC
jgi:hypothetical protein